MRLSHDVATNVAVVSFSFVRQSRDIRECLTAFVSIHGIRRQMSLSLIFSPDSREDCRTTIERYSYDNHMSVAKFSHCKVCQNFAGTCLRHSHELPTTVARQSCDSLATCFAEKIRIKFLNMFKTFATSSRLVPNT